MAFSAPTMPMRHSPGLMFHFMLLPLLCSFSVLSPAQTPGSYRDVIMPEGLHKAWSAFTKAIISGDEKALRASSASCIYCVECLENTPAEDSAQRRFQEVHPRSWYRRKYSKQRYIPAERFISNDVPIIFDKETISRLNNPSLLMFHNDSVNKHLYEKNCIVKPRDRRNAECYEVFVQVVDPSPASEGFQKAFAFMRVGSRYIFCGYSTIP